jgi:hypothetical protein
VCSTSGFVIVGASDELAGGTSETLWDRSEGGSGALEQLHREEHVVAGGDELVERDEVGMRDVGEGAELLLEAVEAVGIEPAQRLERHRHLALAIERLVDDTEAAGADHLLDGKSTGASEIHARRHSISPGVAHRQES